MIVRVQTHGVTAVPRTHCSLPMGHLHEHGLVGCGCHAATDRGRRCAQRAQPSVSGATQLHHREEFETGLQRRDRRVPRSGQHPRGAALQEIQRGGQRDPGHGSGQVRLGVASGRARAELATPRTKIPRSVLLWSATPYSRAAAGSSPTIWREPSKPPGRVAK